MKNRVKEIERKRRYTKLEMQKKVENINEDK